MVISIPGLRNNNPLDWLKMAFQLNQSKLSEAFSKVKVSVNDEKDLEMLDRIVKANVDIQGKLRDPEDENIPIVFDTMRIIKNGIDFSPEEKKKALTFKYTN